MVTFLQLTLIFFVGSLGGWCMELVFRRVVHKKWINPGFLVGPYLPLYGFGLTFLFVICSFDYSFIANPVWQKVFVIAIITVVMTLTEYVTGLLFIKGMRVKLWDYSDRWGNIQGIICPLFSLIWGVIGAIYYLFVHDKIVGATVWMANHLAYGYFVGVISGVMTVDVIHSFNVVDKIRKWAKEHQVLIKYEEFKLNIKRRSEERKLKRNFFLYVKREDLKEQLQNYLDDKQKTQK